MKTRYLLPYSFKIIGWIITVPSFIVMFLFLHYDYTIPFLEYHKNETNKIELDNDLLWNIYYNNFTDELGSVLLITGLLFIAFSKEKSEDERIQKLRLESLLWAVLVNTLLLMICIILFYNGLFLNVMAYNICTTLILFVVRFNWLMHREIKPLKKETYE